MTPKETAAHNMLVSYNQLTQMQTNLANATAAQKTKENAYLAASGGHDEEFVWGGTGNLVTVKAGVVTIAPPSPTFIPIPMPPAAPKGS